MWRTSRRTSGLRLAAQSLNQVARAPRRRGRSLLAAGECAEAAAEGAGLLENALGDDVELQLQAVKVGFGLQINGMCDGHCYSVAEILVPGGMPCRWGHV